MIQIDIPMPANCRYCPCISGYGNLCVAKDKKFTVKEKAALYDHIRDGYRPEWCPMKEVEE